MFTCIDLGPQALKFAQDVFGASQRQVTNADEEALARSADRARYCRLLQSASHPARSALRQCSYPKANVEAHLLSPFLHTTPRYLLAPQLLPPRDAYLQLTWRATGNY